MRLIVVFAYTAIALCALVAISPLPALANSNSQGTPIRLELAHFSEHVRAAAQALTHEPCENIDDYFQNNNQVVMESVLLCQALVAAGYRPEIVFVGFPIQERMAREIRKGNVVGSGMGMWHHHFDEQTMLISHPLLRKGEFEKGIYAAPSNKAIFSVSSAQQLQTFVPISNDYWHQDWKALRCAGFEPRSASNMPAMFQIVGMGRADFLITTFSVYEDMHQTHFGTKLLPVPGYKLAFNQSSHFMISRHHPQGELLRSALNEGLAKLHNSGKIKYAYQQVGFFLDAVKNWQKLGCGDHS